MLLTPHPALAQASAGITGTVTDTSGAIIPNAQVTITNEGTAVVVRTTTGSVGTYSYKGLNPGKYDVAVEIAGFKKDVRIGVTIEVSTTATIDFALLPGEASETVQVNAEQIALNTTQPELGSTIEPVVVMSLPNEVSGRGRQVDSLQFLAPGTTGSTFSHRVSGGVDFEQEIIYNGIPAPQPETEGYTTNFNPPFELVQEYRVERSTFSAQYGLAQGVLTYQMKTGTNSYHGSLFEINRNSYFDSVGFFNGHTWNTANPNDVAPRDRENNYGFSVGGPIRIPHVYDGRQKTFGFYSQEWYKQNQVDTDPSTVPTIAEKTGDFTDYVDGSGKLIPIYDPLTGDQFQCNGVLNVICSGRFSAASKLYIPFIPDPDRPGLDSNKNYVPFNNPHIQHVWGFTVDHNISPSQVIHWAMWKNNFTNYSFDNAPLALAPNPLNSQKFEPAWGSVYLLNYSKTFTPHLVVTAGAGWIGEINNQSNITSWTPPGIVGGTIPPYIVWDGQHTLTKWGTQGSWGGSTNRKLGTAIVNNWLWTKGRHTFNIGGEYRRSYQDDNEDQTSGGQFTFSQKETSIHNTSDPNFSVYGSAFASFLLGIPDQANRSNSQELKLRNRLIAPYIQDDIKINPKLTINLGLRWDIQVPFTEDHDPTRVVFFNLDKPGTDSTYNIPGKANLLGTCGTCVGFDRASIHYGHFGPRLGFAYQLNTKTVVQGGFDIAFLNGGAYEYGTSKVAVSYGNLLVGSFTSNAGSTWVSNYGQAGSSDHTWDTNLMPNPTAKPFTEEMGHGNQISAMGQSFGYAPYTQQWNLNVQRELPWNVFISAAYVGNRIIHLPSQLNAPNQLDPKYLAMGDQLADKFTGAASVDGVNLPYSDFVNDFGGGATVAQALTPYPQYAKILNNLEASGTTFYNSAQVEIEKRFSNGLSFLAGYTLSHLMDNTSSGFSTFTATSVNKYNQKPEWTVSGSDEPQTFKASGTYMLPIGPGKQYLNNHTTGNILGGWQVGWILDYESGTPFGPGENGNPYPNAGNRPNQVSGQSFQTDYSKVRSEFLKGPGAAHAPTFNTDAFATTSTYVLGNAKRNYGSLRGPAVLMENLNASKHFYAGERFQAILQVDYFNAFNRTRFQGPDSNASSGTFGMVTGASSQDSNRQGQVTIRVEF